MASLRNSCIGEREDKQGPRSFPVHGNSGISAGTINMQELWNELHQTRLSVENDQKAYEQTRREIELIKGQIDERVAKKNSIIKKLGEIETTHATRTAEHLHIEIKVKVVQESLAKVQGELTQGWEDLRDVRKNIMKLSNRHLNDSNNFALMYNCTELGRKNRDVAGAKELEEKRIFKHRLEYELEKFLVMLKRVEQSEQDNTELEKQYRSQEEQTKRRENEAYSKLHDINETLDRLRQQESTMDKQLNDEINRLQGQLQRTRESISFYERRVSENQRAVSYQRNNASKAVSSSSMGPTETVYGSGPGGAPANKSARISQVVRPTAYVSQPKHFYNVATNPAVNNTNGQYRQQFTSAIRPQLNNSTTTYNNSHNKSAPCLGKSNSLSVPTATTFLTQSNFVPSKPNPGRVFQFKKKSTNEVGIGNNGADTTIPGPTHRSMTVTLGRTPFSTFQNSRNLYTNESSNSYDAQNMDME